MQKTTAMLQPVHFHELHHVHHDFHVQPYFS
jgi:hypothetical protein